MLTQTGVRSVQFPFTKFEKELQMFQCQECGKLFEHLDQLDELTECCECGCSEVELVDN